MSLPLDKFKMRESSQGVQLVCGGGVGSGGEVGLGRGGVGSNTLSRIKLSSPSGNVQKKIHWNRE